MGLVVADPDVLVTVFTIRRLAPLPRADEIEFSIEDDAAITKPARAMFDPVLEMKDGAR